MRIRILILALAVSPAFAQDEPARRRGELGVRYWLSTGETERSHNAQGLDPSLGNPTSVLLYENLDANVFELFGRHNARNNLFLKGTLGYGKVNAGSFDDEDFFAGQVKFSDTTSSVTEGHIGYGTIDLGYQWVLREGGVTLGVFAGYGQWSEKVEAHGLTDHLGFVGGDISRDVKVITNRTTWKALRVGFNGEFVLGAARLSVDLAGIPYAQYRNEDSHLLRDDLGRGPNIILEGKGVGVQADAELRYEIRRRVELGVGVRYWYMKSVDGELTLPNVGGVPLMPAELYSLRTGVTLSLRRVW